MSFTVPGTYSFTVPAYHTFAADARGSGGGGGGITNGGGDGAAGGYSYFNAPTGNLVGYGGNGGTHGDYTTGIHGTNGAPGTGVGGDGNITGGGAAGGNPVTYPANGSVYDGGYGGAGGRAYKAWAKGSLLTPRSVITIVVGSGGAPGPIGNGLFTPGSYGGNGAVYLSWS